MIPESLLVDTNSPNDPQNQVISTEDLQQNFQHFINNFNQPLFTKYLMQQSPPKLPIVKPVSNYPTPYVAPMVPASSNVAAFSPISSNNPINTTTSRDFIPFKCPLCSLIYRTQAFLNEHMRKEHSVLI